MPDDPIVAEVRKARREILESHDWDYHSMLADAMKRQQESGRQVVSRKGKAPQPGVSRDVYGDPSRRSDPAPGRDVQYPADAE